MAVHPGTGRYGGRRTRLSGTQTTGRPIERRPVVAGSLAEVMLHLLAVVPLAHAAVLMATVGLTDDTTMLMLFAAIHCAAVRCAGRAMSGGLESLTRSEWGMLGSITMLVLVLPYLGYADGPLTLVSVALIAVVLVLVGLASTSAWSNLRYRFG